MFTWVCRLGFASRAVVALTVGVLLVGSLNRAAAADASGLVSEAWNRYRSAKTEREEVEILVITAPQRAGFTRADAEALLHTPQAGVVHKRAVRHVLYAPDWQDKLRLLFSLPPDDAGLGFLVWRQPAGTQDDMWIFMPGYTKVRRAPLGTAQRLAGTDFIYEDVRDLAGERADRSTYSGLDAETLDGRTCDVVLATPKKDTPTAYSRRKLWIDHDGHFPVKMELYDHQERLWKILRNSEVHEVTPGLYRADLIEMHDLQANETTVLLITKRATGMDIPSRVFTQDYLIHPGDD